MSITNEQLAELLSGIARSQQAIIDAIERSDGGWRNTHLIPVLNVAANIRQADPRLIDLPSRILLRLQGRAAVDSAPILADIERLFSQPAGAAVVDASAATAPAPGRFATRAPSAAPATPAVAPRPAAAPGATPAAATAPAAAPAPAAAASAAPPAGAGDEELDFSKS
jgi:hypothetical protein